MPNTSNLHGVNEDKNCYFLICYSNITVTSRYQMVRAHTRGAHCTLHSAHTSHTSSSRIDIIATSHYYIYLYYILFILLNIDSHDCIDIFSKFKTSIILIGHWDVATYNSENKIMRHEKEI